MQQNSDIWQRKYYRLLFLLLLLLLLAVVFPFGSVSNIINKLNGDNIDYKYYPNILFCCILNFCYFFIALGQRYLLFSFNNVANQQMLHCHRYNDNSHLINPIFAISAMKHDFFFQTGWPTKILLLGDGNYGDRNEINLTNMKINWIRATCGKPLSWVMTMTRYSFIA